MEKISGIYSITNNINGKQYIGLSQNCIRRWLDHYSKSYFSTRVEDMHKALYCAMKKYGRQNFTFKVIEHCPNADYNFLAEREIYWIAKLNTYHAGYNETPGGDIPCIEKIQRGEHHDMAKLTTQEVIMCRQYYSEHRNCKEIWEKYFYNKINFRGFQKMWYGMTWRHIMPEVFNNTPRSKNKYSDETIQNIKQLYANGMTCAQIFHHYNEIISRTTINDVCHNKR